MTAVRKTVLAVLVVATAGCAGRNHLAPLEVRPVGVVEASVLVAATDMVERTFPTEYRAVQRAIVTVRGRQFTCDGLLTAGPTEGHHLALVSSFGVVTDLRVGPDRHTDLLKVTPLLREDWSRRFVARDLRCLFVPPANLKPGGSLTDGRLVLTAGFADDGTTAKYIMGDLGWQELELERNGRTFYRATVKHRRRFTPGGPEIPDTFEVIAESYRLDLRIAALTVEGQP